MAQIAEITLEEKNLLLKIERGKQQTINIIKIFTTTIFIFVLFIIIYGNYGKKPNNVNLLEFIIYNPDTYFSIIMFTLIICIYQNSFNDRLKEIENLVVAKEV